MVDTLLDDTKALLDKDFGDDRILKQICRACENNEIISNYERNYVRKLAEKHLGKKPEFTQIPPIEKPSIPDVPIPEIQPIQQHRTKSLPSKVLGTLYSKLKNKKIMFGLGGLALITIIIIIAASSSGDPPSTSNTNPTPAVNIPIPIYVETDLKSYHDKDLISISGTSDPTGTVNLSIQNQNNELVWTEQTSLKSNGQFSTLTIAGGLGWETSGTYTITVDNGKEIKYNTFFFTT